MSNILISIISPVYNSEKFITETINSVINQTYQNWELILVDDGSKDNSVEVVEVFLKQDVRIKLISHTSNLGVAEARNTGVKMAKGNYISFLDSDDVWDRDKLDYQVNFMIENKCHLCHTAYRKIDEKGNVLVSIIPVSKSVNYYSLLKHNEIGLSTSMYNADILGKRYFTKIGWEDFALWLDILKDTKVSLGINKPLVSYRIHQNSSSYNKFYSAQKTWKVYRHIEKLPLINSMYYFIFYAVNSSIKYLRK